MKDDKNQPFRLRWLRSSSVKVEPTHREVVENLEHILTWEQWEKIGEASEAVGGVEMCDLVTLDDEVVGIVSCTTIELDDLICKTLQSESDYPHLFSAGQRWLLGTRLSLRTQNKKVIASAIYTTRVDQVLEKGLSGALVLTPELQQASEFRHMPRNNYLQEVGFGTLYDRYVTPYVTCGFVVSNSSKCGGVRLVLPRERAATFPRGRI